MSLNVCKRHEVSCTGRKTRSRVRKYPLGKAKIFVLARKSVRYRYRSELTYRRICVVKITDILNKYSLLPNSTRKRSKPKKSKLGHTYAVLRISHNILHPDSPAEEFQLLLRTVLCLCLFIN